MKYILTTIAISLCYTANTQILVDTSLADQYRLLIESSNNSIKTAQQIFDRELASQGFAFFTNSYIDTLKIIDDSTFAPTVEFPDPEYSINLPFQYAGNSYLKFTKNNIAEITIDNTYGQKLIQNVLNNNRVNASLRMHYRYDTILKEKISDTIFKSDLVINAKVLSFSLSNLDFPLNKYVYGKGVIETEDFYILDRYKTYKVLNIKYRITYIFAVRRTKNI